MTNGRYALLSLFVSLSALVICLTCARQPVASLTDTIVTVLIIAFLTVPIIVLYAAALYGSIHVQ